jgi:hypothetical protein
MNRAILHSESATRKECVLPKNDKKNKTMNQSANVTFTGGFFSPEKRDNVSFARTPKKGFWSKLGENPKIKEFIKGKTFDKALELANNLSMFESGLFFAIAVTLKPLTIMALPGAKEEDKKYAATKAFLGGCVDFAISSAILYPITEVVKRFRKKIKVDPKILTEKVQYLKNINKFDNLEKVLGYAPKLLLLPIRSAMTIALIPPTLKYLFPEEAKKLKNKKDAKEAVKSKTQKGGNK